jgi:ATP-dependent DNA helicase RecQ
LNQAVDILRKYWGYSGFRPLQQQIIDDVLDKKDVLALLPTGGGKSLCYQVPALMMEGVTIVISPLIALMKDQVSRLKEIGIEAHAIYSGQKQNDIDRQLDNAQFGKTKLLYLSPERLKSDRFRERLIHLPVNLIAVDEAHCISQWGHDFRPAYLEIGEIRAYFPNVPLLALTASATKEVREEIIERLLMKKAHLVKDSFARKNLHYHVVHRQDHLPYITRLLIKNKGAAIIYVRHRRKSVELANWLSTQGLEAKAYHGGMDLHVRDVIQEEWIKSNKGVMVATNAFGMGVDKRDVRLVVHYDLPPGIEDYYQEAGRAGRDEQEAYCMIVVKPSSVQQLKTRIEASFPSLDEIKRVYKSLHIYLDLAVGSGKGETFDFDLNAFCAKFGLRSGEAYQALSILATDGWISMDEAAVRGSTLQIITDVNTLYQYQIAEPMLDLLTKALLRGYEGLWTYSVQINESRLAKFLQWTESQVIKQLQRLHLLGLMEYRKPTAASQLTLLRERVPENNFTIDQKAYAFRKERAIFRMNSMIHYLEDDVPCREWYIREYFDEKDDHYCGKCDRCLEREGIKTKKSAGIYQAIQDKSGITVKDFLANYATEQQSVVKKELRQLAEENKIKIVEDKIYKST